ncbi:MAG: 50S ribosomal protein L30 [Gemmatimonadetes bacterium]|nr:50S ribosomal protein L30 [Gemmatimonadota bacterium]
MGKIRITQRRSAIGRHFTQKRTVRALGIHRLHQSVEHEDTPSVRGMVNKISHLVEVETVG